MQRAVAQIIVKHSAARGFQFVAHLFEELKGNLSTVEQFEAEVSQEEGE